MSSIAAEYQVYIVKCNDGALYTGVTTNLIRRIQQHNGEVPGGAKYTRGKGPVQVVYVQQCQTRGAALRREHEIKQMSRQQKIELIGRG